MSERNDNLLLEDILEACSKIERYIKDLSRVEFLDDEKTIDAVTRNMEIIGEAANKLSSDLTNEFDNIEWRQIIGLRNRLIHAYFGVDNDILWNIITENLPSFKIKIENILNR